MGNERVYVGRVVGVTYWMSKDSARSSRRRYETSVRDEMNPKRECTTCREKVLE